MNKQKFWKEIKEKHPKSYAEFKRHGEAHGQVDGEDEGVPVIQYGGDGGQSTPLDYNTRDLYDYFDGLLIICDLGYDDKYGAFSPMVYMNQCKYDPLAYHRSSRNDAEIAGFTKAFQVREQQLNAPNN